MQIGNIVGAETPVPMNLVVAKELDLRGTQRFGTAFSRAHELIVTGALDPTAIVGRRFALNDAQAAFEQATSPDRTAAKIMLVA